MRQIPDDFRQDYDDLRYLLDIGQFYENDRGEEVCHIEALPKRVEAMQARLEKLPPNVLIIQTPNGRYQITVGDNLKITALDAGKHISTRLYSSNQIELTQRFD